MEEKQPPLSKQQTSQMFLTLEQVQEAINTITQFSNDVEHSTTECYWGDEDCSVEYNEGMQACNQLRTAAALAQQIVTQIENGPVNY